MAIDEKRKAILDGLLELEEDLEESLEDLGFDPDLLDDAIIGAYGADTLEDYEGCVQVVLEQNRLLKRNIGERNELAKNEL